MPDDYDDYEDRRRDDRNDEYDDRPRGPAAAREAVRGPAIALLVTGVISLLMAVVNVAYVYSGMMAAQFAAQRKQMENDPNMPAEQKKNMLNFFDQYEKILTTVTPVQVVTVIVLAVVAILGARAMLNLRNRGLAMTGAIVSMIPCFSGCCLLGLPFGIWAVVVLGRPEVKAAFRAADRPADDYERRADG